MSSRLAYLRDTLQFDRTLHIPFTTRYRIRCSQCLAYTINQIPVHERTCPNDTRECAGCNNRVPTWRKYCEECEL